MSSARFLRYASIAALSGLIVVTTAWELAISPLRPGGSWLALKALPLLFAAKGVIQGNTYTYRWALMLVLAYLAEGCVRSYSETPPSSSLALAEIALAAAFFVTAIAFVRAKIKETRRQAR